MPLKEAKAAALAVAKGAVGDYRISKSNRSPRWLGGTRI
jgi:hypothetical protein